MQDVGLNDRCLLFSTNEGNVFQTSTMEVVNDRPNKEDFLKYDLPKVAFPALQFKVWYVAKVKGTDVAVLYDEMEKFCDLVVVVKLDEHFLYAVGKKNSRKKARLPFVDVDYLSLVIPMGSGGLSHAVAFLQAVPCLASRKHCDSD